jgi:hypothetical protein
MESGQTIQTEWHGVTARRETSSEVSTGSGKQSVPAIVDDLRNICRIIQSERGDFTFFAVFKPLGQRDRFDLMISAKWLDQNDTKSRRYIYTVLEDNLPLEQRKLIDQVVIIDPGNAVLKSFFVLFSSRIGEFVVRNFQFAGRKIRRAYILASKMELSIDHQRPRKTRSIAPG